MTGAEERAARAQAPLPIVNPDCARPPAPLTVMEKSVETMAAAKPAASALQWRPCVQRALNAKRPTASPTAMEESAAATVAVKAAEAVWMMK
jgi:hypothetical protein